MQKCFQISNEFAWKWNAWEILYSCFNHKFTPKNSKSSQQFQDGISLCSLFSCLEKGTKTGSVLFRFLCPGANTWRARHVPPIRSRKELRREPRANQKARVAALVLFMSAMINAKGKQERIWRNWPKIYIFYIWEKLPDNPEVLPSNTFGTITDS